MAGDAQQLNATLVQMLLQQRMQEKAEDRRRQLDAQQAVFDEQRERARESRQQKYKIQEKLLDAALAQADQGALVDTTGLSGEAAEAVETRQLTGQRNRVLEAMTQAQLAGDPNAIQTANIAAENVGFQRGDPDVNADVVRRLAIARGEQQAGFVKQRGEAAVQTEALSVRDALTAIEEGEANRLAASALGLNVATGSNALVDEASLGIPREAAERARFAGQRRSQKVLAQHYMRMAGAEGPTLEQHKLGAYAKLRKISRENDLPFGDPASIKQLSDIELGALLNSQQLFQDPISAGDFVFFTDATAGNRWVEARNAIGDMISVFDEAENAFVDVEEFGDQLRIGPIVGTEGAQQVFRFFGAQDPKAAGYEVWRFTLISKLLKATQGSRPSDFDLSRFLGLMPGIDEVGTPAGTAKIEAMKEMLRQAARAPYDPALQAEIRRFKEDRTDAAKKATAAMRSYESAMRSGDAKRIREAQKNLDGLQKASSFGSSEDDFDFSEAEELLND